MKSPALYILLSAALISGSQAQQGGPSTSRLSNNNDKAPYIGLRHGDDLPRGHRWIGGALLSDPYKDAKQYGVTQVMKGKSNMIWLERLTHNDPAGKAHWETRDVLFLPAIRKNQLLFYVDCFLNDKSDPELIVIVDNVVRGGYYATARSAWRANRLIERFEPLPTKGIKCVGQGDD